MYLVFVVLHFLPEDIVSTVSRVVLTTMVVHMTAYLRYSTDNYYVSTRYQSTGLLAYMVWKRMMTMFTFCKSVWRQSACPLWCWSQWHEQCQVVSGYRRVFCTKLFTEQCFGEKCPCRDALLGLAYSTVRRCPTRRESVCQLVDECLPDTLFCTLPLGDRTSQRIVTHRLLICWPSCLCTVNNNNNNNNNNNKS